MRGELAFKLKSTLLSRSDAAGVLRLPGEAVLIERGRPRWLLLKCPCGCGDEIPVNIDRRAGPAWRLYRSNRDGYSVYPSVWRDTGCQSHFIIWRNQILLLGSHHLGFRSLGRREEIGALANQVRSLLPTHDFVHYVTIAETLREVPWEVLDACRHLVREGFAVEDDDNNHGHFKRRGAIAPLKGFSRYA